jgi:hypothetical protein
MVALLNQPAEQASTIDLLLEYTLAIRSLQLIELGIE